MSAGDLVGELSFPPEWKEGRSWLFFEAIASAKVPTGRAIFAGGVLRDGTNLCGLSYPGGQRLLRVSPETRWAIEERFDGNPTADETVEKMWRIAVQCAAEAKRAAEAGERLV